MLLSLTLVMSTLSIAATRHKVLLIVIPNCPYCVEAKNILNSNGIKYQTTQGRGPVPRLYVDGKYQGTGVDAVETWIKSGR